MSMSDCKNCNNWDFCDACLNKEVDRAEFNESIDSRPVSRPPTLEEWRVAKLFAKRIRDEPQ